MSPLTRTYLATAQCPYACALDLLWHQRAHFTVFFHVQLVPKLNTVVCLFFFLKGYRDSPLNPRATPELR